MPSNEELIRRADLVLGDLEADGGLLQPEQANRFIDLIQEQPTILAQARVERMNSPKKLIDRMGFDKRILQAAVNGTTPATGMQDDGTNDRYLAAARRSAPVTSQISLETSEFIAEVRIPYEVLEDNIERGGLEDHIMRQIAERVAIDLEDLALRADTAFVDAGDLPTQDFYNTQDGWMKRMNVNVVNHNAVISPEMFVSGMLAMPQKYLRNLGALKHFVTIQDAIRYRNVVSQRATGYGDAMLTTSAPIYAAGVQVETAPLMTLGEGFFTFPRNLLFGMQRQITVETGKDIRSREIIVVLTCRVALQIDDKDATVKYTNILAA